MRDAYESRQISIKNGLPYYMDYLENIIFKNIENGVEKTIKKGGFYYDVNLRSVMLCAQKNDNMPSAVDQYDRLVENVIDFQHFMDDILKFCNKYHYFVQFKTYNEKDTYVKLNEDSPTLFTIHGRRDTISIIRIRWDIIFDAEFLNKNNTDISNNDVTGGWCNPSIANCTEECTNDQSSDDEDGPTNATV